MDWLVSDNDRRVSYRRIVLYLMVGMLFFSGCQSRTPPEPAEPVDFSEVFPFETVGIGQRADLVDPVERVIYDSESWADASQDLTPHVAFEPVDFSQVMLVLIAIPTESGGYSIEVESVELEDDVLTISYLFSEPGPDCITPQALAVPFQVIELRRVEGEVLFQQRKDRFSCEDF